MADDISRNTEQKPEDTKQNHIKETEGAEDRERLEMFDRGFTHSGAFHADDVFATALLGILNPDFKVERGSTVPEDFDGIVYDIGNGEFDHHREDKKRENGIPYASFGLLWKKYGKEILDEEDAETFDRKFVQEIDQADNTGRGNLLTDSIKNMNPSWNDEQSYDEAFDHAVSFAREVLGSEFRQLNARREARSFVRAEVEKAEGRILVLSRTAPWQEIVAETDILYVIFPSARGGFMIQAVPDNDDRHKQRLPFPEVWRGRTREELEKETGVKGFTFCHATGYIAAAETLPAARSVAELSIRLGEAGK